jgi:hypothetical protein
MSRCIFFCIRENFDESSICSPQIFSTPIPIISPTFTTFSSISRKTNKVQRRGRKRRSTNNKILKNEPKFDDYYNQLINFAESHEGNYDVPLNYTFTQDYTLYNLGSWLNQHKKQLFQGLSQNQYFQFSQILETGRMSFGGYKACVNNNSTIEDTQASTDSSNNHSSSSESNNSSIDNNGSTNDNNSPTSSIRSCGYSIRHHTLIINSSSSNFNILKQK